LSLKQTVAVLTPVRDVPTAEYKFAMKNNFSLDHQVLTVKGKPVDEARNMLAQEVLALEPRPKYTVWADADAFFLAGTIERLIADLETLPGDSAIVPMHGRRTSESDPLVHRIVSPSILEVMSLPNAPPGSEPIIERVDYTAFHLLVHQTSLLERMPNNPFSIRDGDWRCEDHTFCENLRSIGGGIYVDATCPTWHIGRGIVLNDAGDVEIRDVAYCPGFRPCKIVDGVPTPVENFQQSVSLHRHYGPAVADARERSFTFGPDIVRTSRAVRVAIQNS